MDKNNRGALFINDRKEKDSHPDRRGEAVIGGVEYWVSGWLQTSNKGVKYLSMSYQPKHVETPYKDDQMAEDYQVPFANQF